MIVDCLDWHYRGYYPVNLDKKNAGTHIGMYLAWIINSNLGSEELINLSNEDIQRIKNKNMTGREFLIENCNGILNDKFIHKQAKEFSLGYYLSSREDYCQYLGDYLDTFKRSQKGSLYELEDSWENYEKIARIITSRYNSWKNNNL